MAPVRRGLDRPAIAKGQKGLANSRNSTAMYGLLLNLAIPSTFLFLPTVTPGHSIEMGRIGQSRPCYGSNLLTPPISMVVLGFN